MIIFICVFVSDEQVGPKREHVRMYFSVSSSTRCDCRRNEIDAQVHTSSF